MKLLYSPPSPFVAKVRMAAHHLGIEIEYVKVDAGGQQQELLDANPLGKIPCLLLDDGQAIFDSRVITRFLDRLSGGKLFPANDDALLSAERLEALADGISDCAVAAQYEIRLRPEEKFHQPWFDRQWNKVLRGLDEASKNPPSLDGKLHAGHFALAALLGYLDLRYEGKWQDNHAPLVEWLAAFGAKVPAYQTLKPAA